MDLDILGAIEYKRQQKGKEGRALLWGGSGICEDASVRKAI